MITASPTAPLGEVKDLETYSPSDFQSTSAILCRNTAPLVSFAFSLIRKDVGCRILGREIGANLISIVTKAKAMDLTDLEQKLISMRKRELDRAAKKFNPALLSAIEDKYDCLNIFLQNCTSIQNLTDRITTLFDDKAKGLLTLATVHKSKGLEWPTVFILDRELMPSKWATLPWQQIQERNIQYVAVTRAKLNLYYIESNSWKQNK